MLESTLKYLDTTKQEIRRKLEILDACLINPETTLDRLAIYEEEFIELDRLSDSFVAVINYLKYR